MHLPDPMKNNARYVFGNGPVQGVCLVPDTVDLGQCDFAVILLTVLKLAGVKATNSGPPREVRDTIVEQLPQHGRASDRKVLASRANQNKVQNDEWRRSPPITLQFACLDNLAAVG